MGFKAFTKSILVTTVLSTGLLCSSIAAAMSGPEKLTELLAGYESFSAQFQQVTISDNGREAQKTEGSVLLSKPNRFRWETLQPFPQEIVSDGQYIWIYDPDLEQVTQRSADTQQESAPALILNGQIGQLQKTYKIRMMEDTGAEQLFDLTPVSEQYSFSRIRLAFSDNLISEIMLEDSLGQRTSVVFSKQQINPEFEAESFFFRIPKDTDVIVDIEE
ncbi:MULTISPECIES: outer membrane lipoprotein chaperone LolA [unclassified Neptuniibacter]|jgi:outer membrane lipoprotein carrier protein|uniref:outer membrane lipoprotein chaperone LolA n=1 Tax=unclassified Neptuniibacter TaxID=2630693 RepID=UPI0026E46B40|nr:MULTISPECIES: outer membrane lipoprotein chaperone LolA [unclassified Neptuniibacter]MDO6513351.1 outer membrane lipoprotein chaperone LolA [Neptuniibacter sp. 2_MG-2023]MDO6593880.1 outer membrane lipoprotein chaperone LolA [Neptuniibacter sp. 1_MG-2023]